eukprot:6976394-Heterocapsa_arctica.AAC.1
MRALQLFTRVVQHTVQQIDVDSAVAFRAGYRSGYIHPRPGFATMAFTVGHPDFCLPLWVLPGRTYPTLCLPVLGPILSQT